MKNITLAIDDETLHAVRVYAAKNKTTVNAIVRQALEQIATSEDRVALAKRRIRELSEQSKAEVGSIKWTRDELYDR